MRWISAAPIAVLAVVAGPNVARSAPAAVAIVSPARASALESLAAREARRYVYLRTGVLPRIVRATGQAGGARSIVVVARRDRAEARALVPASALQELKPQGFLIRTAPGARRRLLVIGADDIGTLYGVYRMAERLGARFYLHGDVLPSRRLALPLPAMTETAAPLFAIRGIQPFHDFPEGPDWWSAQGYRAVLAQLAKLRMNFIGLHTYPEGIAEPTVWIGPPSEIGPGASIAHAYPASYQNTLRGDWGYTPRPTSRFAFGAADLFDRDDYASDPMRGLCPKPQTDEQCRQVFQRTGGMLGDAFRFARALRIQTCVGTETPLTVPARVAERLRAAGSDPADQAVVRDLYRGMFRRIRQACPVDWFWLWTPEGWTWSGASQQQIGATMADVHTALDALHDEGDPFRFATCGWVLGPPGDRSAFDRILPRSAAISCISRAVGNDPVEPAFANVSAREKWAIPWMEDDPGLTSVQLWAGRMRRDAADALRYGCTGLLGIHWRTRILSPNIGALAEAAWDPHIRAATGAQPDGPDGGQVAAYHDPIVGAAPGEEPIYQDVRYNVGGYAFRVPRGRYRVTLKFCEVHYNEPGKRVFDVKLQGRTVVENLDVFARVGKDRALDFTFDNVEALTGRIHIGFEYRVELPAIAAITIESPGFSRRINCGGPAVDAYEADPAPAPRGLPVGDFYCDWATAQFGTEVGTAAARIFAAMDGVHPRPTEWTDGPGGLTPDARPWSQVEREYAFAARFARLEPAVRGTAERERFRYWRDEFRAMREIARLRCDWAVYNARSAQVKAVADPAERARRAESELLPLRAALVAQLGRVYEPLLATVGTTGELGTIANWEQHILPGLMDAPGRDLSAMLGRPLPPRAVPPGRYDGTTRMTLLPAPSVTWPGRPVRVRALVLDRGTPRAVTLRWRRMGEGAYRSTPFRHVNRGVYEAALPGPTAAADIEYYAELHELGARPLTAPASGASAAFTVVCGPAAP